MQVVSGSKGDEGRSEEDEETVTEEEEAQQNQFCLSALASPPPQHASLPAAAAGGSSPEALGSINSGLFAATAGVRRDIWGEGLDVARRQYRQLNTCMRIPVQAAGGSESNHNDTILALCAAVSDTCILHNALRKIP